MTANLSAIGRRGWRDAGGRATMDRVRRALEADRAAAAHPSAPLPLPGPQASARSPGALRHPLHPAHRHRLAASAAAAGLRLGHHLLAAPRRVAAGRRLGEAARPAARPPARRPRLRPRLLPPTVAGTRHYAIRRATGQRARLRPRRPALGRGAQLRLAASVPPSAGALRPSRRYPRGVSVPCLLRHLLPSAAGVIVKRVLSQRELNYAVQVTIDRIIFLRICEDRGIELYGRLRSLVNGKNIYARLLEMYVEADARYNSGLFHFADEKGRAGYADRLTPSLAIDDRVLKDILRRLYYPESPYEFSVLPADILGQVYEQFLGKVIRLTAGHRAVVEDKPAVKKAGGVYYTPTYIVDYIVAHTVGPLLEGKNPTQAAQLRILDPACGSGSFLIGAYQHLLDWHLARYVEEGAEKNSKGKAARIRPSVHGEWRLTTAEKKRILLEHIYGVDIDTQAVEVTKLSLLLKVLEGESGESLNSQMKLFHERVLPDLAHNIQCGNSLIGPDFYDGQLDLDDEAAQRINVFDWQAAFPQIFKTGGFDAVIGNPPYIRIQTMKEWAPLEVEHYKERYLSAGKGNYDIYVVFVERGLQLLNKKGRLGFILPPVSYTHLTLPT